MVQCSQKRSQELISRHDGTFSTQIGSVSELKTAVHSWVGIHFWWGMRFGGLVVEGA